MKKKVICMIPARIGSQRMKQKNLALIQNKPILSWGIESAKKSKMFDEIIVNGDNFIFKKIADLHNLNYYHRNYSLSNNDAKSDDVVYDFLNKFKCDYIIWFNAIAPLQNNKDIDNFVKTLINKKFNALFSVKEDYIQALFEDKPVNFSLKSKFSRTQDLKPIKSFVPCMMGWESKVFLEYYSNNNFSFF